MPLSRRGFLGLAASGALAGLGEAAARGGGRRARDGRRTHFRALVIGSGFGGSVAALRLGEAGVDTLVLERGREWPVAPDRHLFGSAHGITDTMFWRRRTARWPAMPPVPVRPSGGVMEVSQETGLDIACAAAVGGGSVVYTCVTLAPPRRYFASLYPAGLSYDAFARTWFPKAHAMLGASRMPDDVYRSTPFTHSRVWDRQLRRAGWTPFPLESTFDWDVVRRELAGTAPRSATVGNSDFGCGNGAKRSLTRTYLPAALATGHVQLRPLHEVVSLERRKGGGYRVGVHRLDPDAAVVERFELSCDLLFLAAGTLNTNRLLVAARDRGDLPDLPAAVGTGFGDNGDQLDLRSQPLVFHGGSQGSPSASAVFLHREYSLPLLVENWVLPTYQALPAVVTFGMTVDRDHRGTFRHERASGRVRLADWTPDKSAEAARALRAHSARVAAANPGTLPVTLSNPYPFTGHPLGGCVIGRCTDLHGRVHGHHGLYVVDGSLLPGSVGGANPSLTITALAEHALAGIVTAGG
ncbi:cholesterol oxidase [Streptomyces longispororuber]|uniref:Cholesterol oxidase n=1 Tax=Streptomyces longispororuber TaxID=68230 RepID=A0A919DFX0_9ACTN|nr:GMC oxidoreductase [Streptomyces longispororuber]GHE41180.1 cholesterol oxidase [Streptomyces longispororuber]